MAERNAVALDRAGRRQALRASALAVLVIGCADLAFGGALARRAALWGGWVALYLLLSLLVERGPPLVAHLVSLLSSTAALLSLFLLAAWGDGTHSLYFLMATMVPVLSVIFSPDDTVSAGVQGAVVLLAGVALQVAEGQPTARLVLYGAVVAATTASAIHASMGHRRRVERLLLEEAVLASQGMELELERQRADRLHAIGKLAEGVAHDVNSPLGSLRSNLAFVREEIAAGRGGARDVAEAIEDSAQALERIRETVASLRAISVEAEPPAAATPGSEPKEASPRPVRRG